MNDYHTKKLSVRAIRFDQHKKPWPLVVEPLYTNGIPEPRLEGGATVVRNGDYVVQVGPVLFTMPPSVFSRLFQDGRVDEGDPALAKALEDIVVLEKRLAELTAQDNAEPAVSLHPDFMGEDELTATGAKGPEEGGEI